MSVNASAAGTSVNILSLLTFPVGFSVTHFADDVKPIVAEPYSPNDFKMLMDGSLYSFSKASPVKISLSVLPNTRDDENLNLLLTATKGSKILRGLDFITMTVTFPGKGPIILSQGVILSGPMFNSVNPAGRLESNTYSFAFGSQASFSSGRTGVVTAIQNVLSLFG